MLATINEQKKKQNELGDPSSHKATKDKSAVAEASVFVKTSTRQDGETGPSSLRFRLRQDFCETSRRDRKRLLEPLFNLEREYHVEDD
jgi:hypothetical protein